MPLPQNYWDLTASTPRPVAAYTGRVKFSWVSELKHLVSYKFLNILWWPVFKFHQRRFTHSSLFLFCKKLPLFTDLWRTIQKGSFAYNTLFLKISPFRRSKTDLADITTLALFFGDEFIDGIAAAAGKPFIRQLVNKNPSRFYLQTKIKEGHVTLCYRVDLKRLLPPEIMQQVNAKYQISYEQFNELLEQFLGLMNEYLYRFPFPQAQKAAAKITDTCNTCFDSFLHDVNSCYGQDDISKVREVLFFHETKTAYMQKKLLELRCILVNKEEAMSSIQSPGWLDIMRVIQIYDDIHDPVMDDGFQDNLLLSIACHYFPEESNWFCTNKHILADTKNQALLLSLYMPCSTEYCLQLASDKIMAMNWEQQKIMHYLLFKNKYVLYKESGDENFARQASFLLCFYKRVKNSMPHLTEQGIKSFAVNICVHLCGERKHLLKKVSLSSAYQLRYNLLSMSAETKANIFDAVTT